MGGVKLGFGVEGGGQAVVARERRHSAIISIPSSLISMLCCLRCVQFISWKTTGL